jgi:hypothetical protein
MKTTKTNGAQMDDLDELRAFRAHLKVDPSPKHVRAAWSAVRERMETRAALSRIRSRVRRLRLIAVGVTAAALALAMAVALPAVLPAGGPGSAPSAAAGVSFTDRGDYVIARITNPAADVAQMEAAFAERGFDIKVTLIPVSPSLVGTIPYVGEDGAAQQSWAEEPQILTGPGCVSPGGGADCPIGLRIPAGFQGQASITVGRPAEPGEVYTSAADATAPGEALHCSGIPGMTVERALPLLQQHGLSALWRSDSGRGGIGDNTDPSTIANQFVTDATPASSNKVYLFVSPDKPDYGSVATYMSLLDHGC